MTRYATNTSVSCDASLAEIRRTLRRYGAPQDGFIHGEKGDRAFIGFEFNGARFQINLMLPDPASDEFQRTPGKRLQRTPEQAEAAWEQACRQRWRALALVIKAKLEAVESGISTVEQEFLANRVLPSGKTVGDDVIPALSQLRPGDVPDLLPGLKALRERNG